MLKYNTMKEKLIQKYPIFVKGLIEFGPILVFVVLFEIHGFLLATFGMVIAVLISILYLYITQKALPLFTVLVSLITLMFAVTSILFHNPKILIFRDTFYDYFFAAAIFFGLYRRQFFLKRLFSHAIKLTDRGWRVASYSWGGYFLVTGTMNEIIRETGTQRMWIDFKVIVIITTIILGGLLALYLRDERVK